MGEICIGPGSIAFLLSGLLATSCVPSLNGNEARAPNTKMPTAFSGDVHEGSATTSSAQEKWNEFFGNADLLPLISEALENNRELNAELQEIVIAHNEVSARQGEYVPRVGARAGASVEKVGKYTSQGASDESTRLPDNLGNFTFGLSGSWEVDVWQKLRNSAKAAGFRYLASVEAKNFMVTQIVAEIARSYYELLALDSQVEILKRNVELQTSALEVVKLEKEAAKATELAVQKFEAEVLKNRSRLYEREQAKTQTENRINFLVGRYPQAVRRSSAAFNAPLPKELRAGLPSQLLDNRSDVRQAALELEATKFDVGAARAAFYPSLSIDAQIGYRAFNPEHLVTTPESLLYGVGASLTAPLLNRSGITAQYRSANARQLQAVFNYEKVLLQAFSDVATKLAMIDNLQKGYELQAKQVEALSHAVETSNVLFQSARADYMEVLLTRRDSLDAQMDLAETKKRQFHAMVDVYQALGGGWR